MYARGEIVTGKRAATTLPQVCVVLRDGRSYVFELGADKHVIQRTVITGRRVGEMIEIVEGLSAGVSVVSTGAAFLNDGDLVRVVDAAASAAQSAPAATQSGAR